MAEDTTPLRIWIAVDNLWLGGHNAAAIQLSKLLRDAGHEVRIHCALGASGHFWDALPDGVAVTGDEELADNIQQAVDGLRDFRPDLYLVNHSSTSLAILIRCREYIGSAASILHTEPPQEWGNLITDPLLTDHVDAHFWVSEDIRDWLLSQGVPEDICHPLRNLVDAEQFTPPPEKDRGDGVVRFGYVGRVSKEKRPHLVVAAYTALATLNQSVRLVLAGIDHEPEAGMGSEDHARWTAAPREELAAALRIAREAGVPSPVTHGRLLDVRPVLWQLDALVLPSTYEHLPIVALEAMACGVPVIGPRAGQMPSLVGDEERGWTFVPTGNELVDLHDLSDAMRQALAALSVPVRRRSMAESCRSFVLEKYSEQRAGAEVVRSLTASARRKTKAAAAATTGSRCDYLVTGGCGFIGSTLVRALVLRGHRVAVLDDFSTGDVGNIRDLGTSVRLHVGSIEDPWKVQTAMADVSEEGGVFHLAARSSVPRSFEDPDATISVNVDGTRNVAEAAEGRRVVFSSSSSVYGLTPVPQHEDQAEEGLQLSPYAESKWAGDAMVRKAGGVALRFFNVYGPRQRDDSAYTGVIALFARALLAGGIATICGDGLQSRAFVFVDDVVDALLRAMRSEGAGEHAINVGGDRSVSVWEMLTRMSNIVGPLRATIERAPPREGDIRHSYPRLGLAEELLGWRPRVDIDEGLRRTIRWYGTRGKQP